MFASRAGVLDPLAGKTAGGVLAEILLLDSFRATFFAAVALALSRIFWLETLCKQGMSKSFGRVLPAIQAGIFYNALASTPNAKKNHVTLVECETAHSIH